MVKDICSTEGNIIVVKSKWSDEDQEGTMEQLNTNGTKEMEQPERMQPSECDSVDATEWMQPSECESVDATEWMQPRKCDSVDATEWMQPRGCYSKDLYVPLGPMTKSKQAKFQ
ncbi:hypothetical protein Rs2_04873 [Raphanus sativus]|nr:hypothetical protein Rs2_04873 [Raphanus sativus]